MQERVILHSYFPFRGRLSTSSLKMRLPYLTRRSYLHIPAQNHRTVQKIPPLPSDKAKHIPTSPAYKAKKPSTPDRQNLKVSPRELPLKYIPPSKDKT